MNTSALTVPEFLAQYRIGRTLAYAEMKSGRLRYAKVGRRTLIPRAAAEDWLAARLMPAAPAALPGAAA